MDIAKLLFECNFVEFSHSLSFLEHISTQLYDIAT